LQPADDDRDDAVVAEPVEQAKLRQSALGSCMTATHIRLV
jgi:hypothetical protein